MASGIRGLPMCQKLDKNAAQKRMDARVEYIYIMGREDKRSVRLPRTPKPGVKAFFQ